MATTQQFGMDVRNGEDGRAVIGLRGEIDAASAPELRAVAAGLIDEGHADVVLDLRDVAFMDSTGLGEFVTVMKQLQDRGGVLTLTAPTAHVRRMLAISGLDHLLRIEPSGATEVAVHW